MYNLLTVLTVVTVNYLVHKINKTSSKCFIRAISSLQYLSVENGILNENKKIVMKIQTLYYIFTLKQLYIYITITRLIKIYYNRDLKTIHVKMSS